MKMLPRWAGALGGALLGVSLAAGAPPASTGTSTKGECASSLETRSPDGWLVSVHTGPGEPCSSGTYVVDARGPQGQHQSFAHPREGVVETLWVEDFDRDGTVEIAVQTRQAGSGAYADVAIFAGSPMGWVSRRIVPLAGDVAVGYQGHDRFEFVDGALVRRFPIYRKGDPNCCPTGGTRVLGLSYAEGRWVPFHPRPKPMPPGPKPGQP
jgi:hypothetical protein